MKIMIALLISVLADEAFKALAKVYANDSVKTAEDFQAYVESYSGYTSYIDTLKERYSLSDDFSMQEADKEAWIVKRFEAESTKTIEEYYTTNLDNAKSPNKAITSSTTLANKYTSLTDKLQSTFTIQAFYKDEFAPTHYDLASDSFIIDDATAFNTNIADYFNNDTHTIQEKSIQSNSNEKYHNLMANNYKNSKEQDIMIDILKVVA